MPTRNLDEFFQETKPTLEYDIKNKHIIGDISTLSILKASSLYNKEELIAHEDKMTKELFTLIFGKENAMYLIENLTPQGFVLVAEDVTNAIMGETGGTSKSPSGSKK